jgi:hypothetical protein
MLFAALMTIGFQGGRRQQQRAQNQYDTTGDSWKVIGELDINRPFEECDSTNQLIGVQSCLLSMRQGELELKNAINAMQVRMERNF